MEKDIRPLDDVGLKIKNDAKISWGILMGKMIKRFDWLAEKVRGKSVLEIDCIGQRGCHPAHEVMSKSACSCLGISTDRKNLAIMRKEGYNVIYGNSEKYASPSKFDCVVMTATFEHLNNIGLAFDCARSNLLPEGELIITACNARYLIPAIKNKYSRYHNFIMSPKLLSNFLERHGFQTIETVYLKPEGKTNIAGWLYENLFLRLLPQYTLHFGVVAKKGLPEKVQSG